MGLTNLRARAPICLRTRGSYRSKPYNLVFCMSDKSPCVTEAQTGLRSAKTEPLSGTYNLFGAKDWSGQMCAVTLDQPIPGFVTAEQWRFIRTLEPTGSLPGGFDLSAASESMRLRGFYLFNLPADAVPRNGRFAPFQVPTSDQITLHARTILARIHLKKLGTSLG